MQRPSWNLLKEQWADRFFSESLSEFISRLHEDRGKETLAVVVFSPDDDEIPPDSPPVSLLVLYREDVDFLRDNIFLRSRDPSGIFNFFSYGINAFGRMVSGENPIALSAVRSGVVIFEREDALSGFLDGEGDDA